MRIVWISSPRVLLLPSKLCFLYMQAAFLTVQLAIESNPCLKDDNCFQVLDDKNVKRRFRASNYQSSTRVKPFICTMPMRLDDGWNQIQVDRLLNTYQLVNPVSVICSLSNIVLSHSANMKFNKLNDIAMFPGCA